MLPFRAVLATGLLGLAATASRADELPKVRKVERQPLAAQAKRLADALDYLGNPLPERDKQALAAAESNAAKAVATIQDVLDKHCLAGVHIEKLSGGEGSLRITTTAGPAALDLAEQGWRVF